LSSNLSERNKTLQLNIYKGTLIRASLTRNKVTAHF